MWALRLALTIALLGATPTAMGGASADPNDAVATTLRGLTVLECAWSKSDCTFISKEGHIVWVATDIESWDRMPELGTVVDVRSRYWASGRHRDAFRAFELSADQPGWVRPVGSTRCLVVHGYVGEVRKRAGIELIVPVRVRPKSFHAEVAAKDLIAFEPMRSELVRVQTTEKNPRLRSFEPRALKLVRRTASNDVRYWEVTRMGSTSSMRAGRCSA